MSFQIIALDVDQFSHLFGQDDETLARHGVQCMIADNNPGYPCRVSLQDAKVGETVLLLNFEHQSASSPYRSSHAIFVREGATRTNLGRGEIPEMLRSRLLSVRAFDARGMMVDADVVNGTEVESLITRLLDNASTDYLHIQNARLGCYAAKVERA